MRFSGLQAIQSDSGLNLTLLGLRDSLNSGEVYLSVERASSICTTDYTKRRHGIDRYTKVLEPDKAFSIDRQRVLLRTNMVSRGPVVGHTATMSNRSLDQNETSLLEGFAGSVQERRPLNRIVGLVFGIIAIASALVLQGFGSSD